MQICIGLRIQMLSRILTLPKKAMKMINFQSRNCHPCSLFLKLKLLEFNDNVFLKNVLLNGKFINNFLPPVLNNWFTICSNIYNSEKT